jgi:hypothetical protein
MSTPAEAGTAQAARLGVQAGRRFEAGSNIERAPVVVFPGHEAWILGRTGLAPYLEPWEPPSGKMALPLGYGVLYRDDGEPNARFVARPDEMAIDVVALRDIEAGEDVIVSRLEEVGLAVTDIGISTALRELAGRLGLRRRRPD